MWPLTQRTLRDNRFLVLGYVVVNLLMLTLYVGLFPSMADQAAELNKVLEQFPQGFLKAFNVGDVSTILTNFESFLASRHYGLLWPIMALMLAIGLAGNAIAGEIESGRIEFLLAQPISRTGLFISRYLSGIILLLLFVAASVLCVPFIATMFNVDYTLESYFILAYMGFLFALTVFTLAMFFSTVFSEKSKVSLYMTGIVIASYTANVVANLNTDLENLKYLSFFHYFDANIALVDREFDGTGILVFLCIIVVCLIAGIIRFNHRDIAT